MLTSSAKNFFLFGTITIAILCGYIVTSLANAPIEQAATETAAPPAAVTTTPTPSRLASLVEGQHYITKFPNSNRAKAPVLVEFFSYMCPHCYRMEGTVKRWKNQKPDDIEFIKIPAMFSNTQYQLTAKAHYIAEELDIMEQFAQAMYSRIHVDRRPPRSERDLENLFTQLGVSKDEYKKAAENNFNVEAKLRRATFLMNQYQVSGVPYFLVNYKYELGPEANKSQDALFNIWNNLPYKGF